MQYNSKNISVTVVKEVLAKLLPNMTGTPVISDMICFFDICDRNRIDPEAAYDQPIIEGYYRRFEILEDNYPWLLYTWTSNTVFITAEGERLLKALNGRLNYHQHTREMGDLFAINNIKYDGQLN